MVVTSVNQSSKKKPTCNPMNLRTLSPLLGLSAILLNANAQNLFRPPDPPFYTSTEPPQAILTFGNPDEAPFPATLGTQFEGMFQTSSIRPPDPHGFVGPSGIIQTVNLRIAYYTKAGALIWGPTALSTFWAGVGNTGSGNSDPRVTYDRGSGRFYVIMQENLAASSFINVAVSKTSNPLSSTAADWWFYRLNMTEVSGGSPYGGDYPGLGVD